MNASDSNLYSYECQSIQEKAKEATIELLKQRGDKCYVAVYDFDDEVDAESMDDISITIFGVGLDKDGKLLIAAMVDNIGYGNSPYDFPQGFTSVDEISPTAFPEIYRFVAENIEKATTREEAEKVFVDYYD